MDAFLGGISSAAISEDGNSGNGGRISISSEFGSVIMNNGPDNENWSTLNSSSSSETDGGVGNGGEINISALTGDIETGNWKSLSSTNSPDGSGNGGAIFISLDSGDITTGNLYSDSNSRGDTGNGGTITISSASGDITTGNLESYSGSFSGSSENGGAISISSTSGDITTGDLNSASGSERGNAGRGGRISISSASGNITTGDLNSFSFSEETGNAGSAGEVFLRTREGFIRGNDSQSQLIALSAAPQGDTGAGGIVTLEGNTAISDLEVITLSSGGASGNVQIQGFGDSLTISNLDLTTTGQVELPNFFSSDATRRIILDLSNIGQSGNTEITSAGPLTLNDVDIQSDANSNQPAGNVTITSPGQITFNRSRINSNANNEGRAGEINITTKEGITIQGLTDTEENSGIFARTTAIGKGGNIILNTPRLTLADNAAIEATTSTGAEGGEITFNAPNALTIQGTGRILVDATDEAPPESLAGDLNVNAPSVFIDGVELSASTSGEGRGGDVELNIAQLTFANGGQISASTTASGRSGSLTIQNSDPLRIQGDGQLTVAAEEGATGAAGTLKVIAPSVILDDGVTLSASTDSEQGGAVMDFDVDGVLLLRRNSFINAQATSEMGGDAANIEINAGFVIAVPDENSDIIANAVGGNGGNIDITTNQLLGFTVQSDFIPTADLRNNTSNDISASSQFGQAGLITITDPFDPTRGLIELPTLSPTPPIQRGCSASTVGASRFTVTGRGGLPPSPEDILNRDRTLADLGPETIASSPPTDTVIHPPANESPEPLVEAQGLIKDADGWVTFVAEASEAIPPGDWRRPLQCSDAAVYLNE